MGLAKPLASVSLIPEHGAGSSESIRHVELTGAMEPDEWEIEADELELGPRIGIGSFGEVYRSTWRHTDVAVKKFLEQDLSPQLMQVRLSWRLKRKREKDYTFWHQFDEKRSIVLGCSDWHCNFCTLRPGGLFQKMTLCVDKAVKVLLEQDLSAHLMRVFLRPL